MDQHLEIAIKKDQDRSNSRKRDAEKLVGRVHEKNREMKMQAEKKAEEM